MVGESHRVFPGECEAKFWIEIRLATSVVVGMSARQVAKAEDVVRRHLEKIRAAWVRRFGR